MQNFCLTIEMILEYDLKKSCCDFHHILSVVIQITSILCGVLLKHKLRFPSLTVAQFEKTNQPIPKTNQTKTLQE